jgi:RimJ/RimL family protein N-acetyltransferase
MATPQDPPVVFLRGERVYLRPVELGDAERYRRWLCDEAVRRTLKMQRPLTEKMEREFIEQAGTRERDIVLAAVLVDGDRHIGGAGLHGIRWKDRAGTLGLFIGETDCWDRGYGSEMLRLLLRYAFESLNFNRVDLTVFSHNPRAVHVYEKAGFVREGVHREWAFVEGRYIDELCYSMLAREYQAAKAR